MLRRTDGYRRRSGQHAKQSSKQSADDEASSWSVESSLKNAACAWFPGAVRGRRCASACQARGHGAVADTRHASMGAWNGGSCCPRGVLNHARGCRGGAGGTAVDAGDSVSAQERPTCGGMGLRARAPSPCLALPLSLPVNAVRKRADGDGSVRPLFRGFGFLPFIIHC